MIGLSDFVGKKIVKIRPFTKEELDFEGWDEDHGTAGSVIELDNGAKIYASSDDEGNSPGTLFGVNKKGEGLYIYVNEHGK